MVAEDRVFLVPHTAILDVLPLDPLCNPHQELHLGRYLCEIQSLLCMGPSCYLSAGTQGWGPGNLKSLRPDSKKASGE